jgi:integrase
MLGLSFAGKDGLYFRCGIGPFLAKPMFVALYLNFLRCTAATSSPIEEAVSALSWVHQLAGVEDPTSHSLVKQVVAGAKRILAHKTAKKEPVTIEILRSQVDRFGQENASLADIRTLAICMLGFAGFFRYNEIANLKGSDVSILSDHMEIFVEASKTDQYRDGARVVIARTGSSTCPVGMLERYLDMAGVSCADDRLLFRGLTKTKNGYKLRESGGLSYSRIRELVLEQLLAIGLDKRLFGLHSLRSGGASAAAQAGVPDRLFKRHGRWRSEAAKDGYIKDKLVDRLSVSSLIGLRISYTFFVTLMLPGLAMQVVYACVP